MQQQPMLATTFGGNTIHTFNTTFLFTRDILLKDNAIQLREDAALITILRNPLKCKFVSDATEHESLGDTVFNIEKNMMSSICPSLLSDEGELSINPYVDIW